MSVLMELTMFPMDKGESMSAWVSRIIGMFDESELDYRLTPMGTVIEVDDLEKALKIVADAYSRLETDCNRVYATLKLDIRKGKGGRLAQKIESVEKKLGKKVKT
ncbi:MAG: hypothetical protein A4E57_01470 [Syntrophorhabdaceae bacterium PtaU1.Bin034]|jgi:uncharacterized protein (TIGR00106 family)|nr:MAG: hypothetical protein A4E57_01470 [Syntrophorhabdaceae bacterium PtaU1.Bin034]